MASIGSHLQLISKCEIRYEGILHSLDAEKKTICLSNVRTFGTEDRKTGADSVAGTDSVYDCIIFNAGDVKSVVVFDRDSSPKTNFQDPAIISSANARSNGQHPSVSAATTGSNNRNANGGGNYATHTNHNNNRGGWNHGRGGGGRGFYDSNYSRDRRGGGRGGRGGGRGGYGNYDDRPRNYGEGGRGNGGNHRALRSDGHTGKEFRVGALGQKDIQDNFSGDFDFSRGKEEFEMKKKEFEEQNLNKPTKAYNKSDSFFDHISCDQKESRLGRDEMKKTDTETFGSDMVGNMRSFRRRGRFRR